jgi:1-acyl-sn-glycerol-3-phosphate acyltransferase
VSPGSPHPRTPRDSAWWLAALRTVLFAGGAWLLIAVFTLTLPLLALFHLRFRYAVLTHWARISLGWLRLTCGLGYRVRGRENIPRATAVVLSNHQSAWETLAYQAIFPPQVWVLKRSLLKIPLFGWSLAMLKPVAIDRGGRSKALRQVLEQGQQRLADGMWIIVFPEGTRMPHGTLGDYNPGGAMLAERAGCPVVPVVHNAGAYWPRSGFPIRGGTIDVVIGPAIDTRGQRSKQVNQQIQAWARTTYDGLIGVPGRPTAEHTE